MKRLPLALALVALVAFPAAATAAPFPDTIALDGVAPEGVAIAPGGRLFAGSLSDGRIVEVELRTGAVSTLTAPSDGRIAVGLSADRRGRLFVAGGGPALGMGTGAGYVYDTTTGAELASYDFGGGFVNDVVVTQDAAWFTDSFAPVLYRVAIAPDGSLGSGFEVVPLDIGVAPGEFALNGIDATADGRTLIVVHSPAGRLFRVDADTGDASEIALSEPVTFGDGILLAGRRLYVVRNQIHQVAVVDLAGDLSSGEVVGTITDDDLAVPTTIARFGGALYAVNAGFGPGPYQVVRLPLS